MPMKNSNLVDNTDNHINSPEPDNSLELKNNPNPMIKTAIPTTPVNPDKITNVNSHNDETLISFEEFVAQKYAAIAHFSRVQLEHQTGVRLINSKFPTIDLFDDVAEPEEFEALYAIQSLTNLRCKNDNGTITNLPKDKMPAQIEGRHYACAPFTHIDPDGSRFSNGSFGIMYLADSAQTAMTEVCFHQLKQWQNIEGLHFDSVVMRQLDVTFSATLIDIGKQDDSPLYDQNNYLAGQSLGFDLYHLGQDGIQFESVRRKGHTCWALMTPKGIEKVVKSHHYELIYNGKEISHVRLITNFEH